MTSSSSLSQMVTTTEHVPPRLKPRKSIPPEVIEIGKNLQRSLALISGLVLALVSVRWGIDGVLMTLAGASVGYGLRLKGDGLLKRVRLR